MKNIIIEILDAFMSLTAVAFILFLSIFGLFSLIYIFSNYPIQTFVIIFSYFLIRNIYDSKKMVRENE